jgi:crotonobetainyl-CoA:carnitine CoA-transferase CaiB-like acyl-CoA transferase
MFDHPQVQAEGIVTTFTHPVVGHYRGLTRPITFSRTLGPEPFAAPTLGPDDAAVMIDREPAVSSASAASSVPAPRWP